MQALILAGGEGTRLRPLTSTMPKPVVPLVDRPFISYMLEWLRGHGVDDVILSCGPKDNALDNLIKEVDQGDYSHTSLYIGIDNKRPMVVEATQEADELVMWQAGERAVEGVVRAGNQLGSGTVRSAVVQSLGRGLALLGCGTAVVAMALLVAPRVTSSATPFSTWTAPNAFHRSVISIKGPNPPWRAGARPAAPPGSAGTARENR